MLEDSFDKVDNCKDHLDKSTPTVLKDELHETVADIS